jgi:hypothetical protein
MRFLIALLIVCVARPLQAEYRAYQLLIQNQTTGTEKTVLSTLDHLQYPGYYPVAADERVSYVTSWRCYGRTGNFRRICPNPNAEGAEPKPNSAADRTPAGSR